MGRFTWDDTVKAVPDAPAELRPGICASVVGMSLKQDRRGDYLARFPSGVVYTIEFEDGSSVEAPEHLLEKGTFPSERP
jgi:hypothetical protein